MAQVIVERSFDDPVVVQALVDREQAVGWCLEQYQVTPTFSLLASSGRHMVCFYEAPDAEAVRNTQRTGGLPFDRIWSGAPLLKTGAVGPTDTNLVVVQRSLPRAHSDKDVNALVEAAAACFTNHRTSLRQTFLSRDGQRMLCCFEALDAEAVRNANQLAGVPYERAWPARFVAA